MSTSLDRKIESAARRAAEERKALGGIATPEQREAFDAVRVEKPAPEEKAADEVQPYGVWPWLAGNIELLLEAGHPITRDGTAADPEKFGVVTVDAGGESGA